MFLCQGLRLLISVEARPKVSSLKAGYDIINLGGISISIACLFYEQFSSWRVNVSAELTDVYIAVTTPLMMSPINHTPTRQLVPISTASILE